RGASPDAVDVGHVGDLRGEHAPGLTNAGGTLAAAPAIPLLFQGEESADPGPFQYFTSHPAPGLAPAVCRGRAREMVDRGFPCPDRVRDRQDEGPSRRSKREVEAARPPAGAARRRLYADLLALRRREPRLGARAKAAVRTELAGEALVVSRG